MIYEHLHTVCEHRSKHISDLTADMPHIYTPYIKLDIFGIPAEWDEEKIEAVIDDSGEGVPLGSIEGYLVLGAAMEHIGEDLYECCDATSEELENAVSALMERQGPLEEGKNLFHITEMNVNDPDAIDPLLEDLPLMLLTHLHVVPDLISYNPAPLPHEKSKLEQVQEDLAMLAYNETSKRLEKQIFGGQDEEEDDDAPQLMASPEQLNVAMGKRNAGESYAEEYIDTDAWQPFLENGFQEWGKTRMLYKIVEEF